MASLEFHLVFVHSNVKILNRYIQKFIKYTHNYDASYMFNARNISQGVGLFPWNSGNAFKYTRKLNFISKLFFLVKFMVFLILDYCATSCLINQ